MNKTLAIGVAAVLVLLLLVFSTTYTVSFHEVAIQQTFGQSDEDSVRADPGLKIKLPLIQDKQKFDTRLQILESPLEEISLSDGQQVVVRAFLLWKVAAVGDDGTPDREGALEFATRYSTLADANEKLRDPFLTQLTGVISAYGFDDLVGASNRLVDIEDRIKDAMDDMPGIRPVSVGISQILLPERATTSVVSRMEATRARQAESYRERGRAEAAAISATAATLAEKIRTFAEQRAADIRATGDERAAEYMREMSDEEELAIFLVWLDTLQDALATKSTIFLDATNHEPWHLLNVASPTDSRGIPMPGGVRVTGRDTGDAALNVQSSPQSSPEDE